MGGTRVNNNIQDFNYSKILSQLKFKNNEIVKVVYSDCSCL